MFHPDSVGEIDGCSRVEVVAVALELRTGLNQNAHEQIARLAAGRRRFALAGEPKHHAVLDAGRNLHLDWVGQKLESGSMTGDAGGFDNHAVAEATHA